MSSCTQIALTDLHPISTRSSVLGAGWVERLGRAFRRWRERQLERESFALITERDLHDMGRNRWEIESELAKPFWRG